MASIPRPLQDAQQSQRLSWYAAVVCVLFSVGLLCWDYGLMENGAGVSKAVRPKTRDLRALQSQSTGSPLPEGNTTIGAGENGDAGDGVRASALPPLGEKTLVIYNVHHSTLLLDNLHGENLDFFLKVGVGEESGRFVDYLFLVPPAPDAAALSIQSVKGRRREVAAMPPVVVIPPAANVRVLERPQDCLGCSGLQDVLVGANSNSNSTEGSSGSSIADGTIASLPLTVEGLLSRYTHFVFVDSSVRGPFLPRYMHRPRRRKERRDRFAAPQATKPWTSVFTDRLGPEVKLVGRSVSCEVELHVQTPVWATDRIGLQLLLKKGVLECATNAEMAKQQHELGATRAVVGAGYGVDSLMLRYRGLNLTRVREMELPCMAGDNPSIPLLNDGLPINPLEVVFVVARPHLLASDLPLRRYTDYLLGRGGVKKNEMYTERGQAVLEARRQRLARMVEECEASLDSAHMMSKCPDCIEKDLGEIGQRHFIQHYVMLGYDYRFTIEETDVGKLPHSYCEAFVRYQAPDVTS